MAECPQCPGPDEPGFWSPFCDFCGDDGCPECDFGTTENHDHERWERMERRRHRAELRRIADSGITPW